METIRWNSSSSQQMANVARTRWGEVRWGLALAIVGLACLLLLGLPALVLQGPVGQRLAVQLRLEEDVAFLAWAVGMSFGGLGFLMLLAGVWRCLMRTPQGHGGKELLFACLLCYLMGPALFAAGHFLGGAENYPALARGHAGLRELSTRPVGSLIQLGSVSLLLLAVLLFTGYTRAVACNLRDEGQSRAVVRFFWFVAFLLGGTAGVVLYGSGPAEIELWLALLVGWLGCLAWHWVLLVNANRCIGRALNRRPSGVHRPVGSSGQIAVARSLLFGGPP